MCPMHHASWQCSQAHTLSMHPRHAPCRQADGAVAEGFEGVGELFPPGLFDGGRPGRGEMALGWEGTSGKFALVVSLLEVLRATTDDK